MTLNLKTITHIIFDVDGTLYSKDAVYDEEIGSIEDSHEFMRYAAYSKAVKGKTLEEIAEEVIAEYHQHITERTLMKAVKQFPDELKHRYKELVEKHRSNGNLFAKEFGANIDYFAKLVCNVDFGALLKKDDELIQTIGFLKAKGYKLGILTNEVYATIDKIVNVLGLCMDDFRLETGSQYPIFCKENGVAKPDTKAFINLLRLNNIPQNRALCVGDSLSKDIEPAVEVGMIGVLVGDSAENNQYLTIAAVHELKRYLR